ncbi:MAG: FCD domain-containing protein [Burkholderiales bacterium]|nr:FCD domain-containing protein [Burkholderiales bacterium]
MDALSQPAAGAPRTLVERAYLELRRDIVDGHHRAGDRLRVEHLKDRYRVGAGTLREALALLVSDALVVAEGQRGFRVTAISLADLEDLTAKRVLIETEALRQSIRHGDAAWERELGAAFVRLTAIEGGPDARRPGDPRWEADWEAANKAFHDRLIGGCDSSWNRLLLGILYRHAERYRHVALRLGALQDNPRDVHREHTEIYEAAIARREARAALALEDHVRLTFELLSLRARELDEFSRA